MTAGDLLEVVDRGSGRIADGADVGAVGFEESLGVHSAAIIRSPLRFCNIFLRSPAARKLLLNDGVDNKQLRRANLDWLVAQLGSLEAVARQTNITANYLSQIRIGSRNMGDITARRVEQGMKQMRGWMDIPHFSSTDEAMNQTEVLQILGALSESDREQWLRLGRLLVEGGARGPSNPFGSLPKGGK